MPSGEEIENFQRQCRLALILVNSDLIKQLKRKFTSTLADSRRFFIYRDYETPITDVRALVRFQSASE